MPEISNKEAEGTGSIPVTRTSLQLICDDYDNEMTTHGLTRTDDIKNNTVCYKCHPKLCCGNTNEIKQNH
jgi:hypothetical protein